MRFYAVFSHGLRRLQAQSTGDHPGKIEPETELPRNNAGQISAKMWTSEQEHYPMWWVPTFQAYVPSECKLKVSLHPCPQQGVKSGWHWPSYTLIMTIIIYLIKLPQQGVKSGWHWPSYTLIMTIIIYLIKLPETFPFKSKCAFEVANNL